MVEKDEKLEISMSTISLAEKKTSGFPRAADFKWHRKCFLRFDHSFETAF